MNFKIKRIAIRYIAFALLLASYILLSFLPLFVNSQIQEQYNDQYIKMLMLNMTLILDTFYLGSFISLVIVLYKFTKPNQKREKPKKNILFLRKFKTGGDYRFPIIISGIIGKRGHLVTLSSSYFRSTLFFQAISIFDIPIHKRILNPLSYEIEFSYAGKQNWFNTFKELSKNASCIIADISELSENHITELEFLSHSQKKDSALFLICEDLKGTPEEVNIISLLEKFEFDIEKNLFYYPNYLNVPNIIRFIPYVGFFYMLFFMWKKRAIKKGLKARLSKFL
ncbi:MAG: hypothetical protein GTN68_38080 [Candidatus Aminicenantes bacterium]|nr:hypothetical protein [Candidatus Aminicenantes bacterium]NIO86377.1 hypothetical protein [Candidatus Aminicenantes bacterium]NIQ69687.1 hypothetical protein [Candidatus Aminicenantes bacterium]